MNFILAPPAPPPERRSSIPGLREVACERRATLMYAKLNKSQEDGFKGCYVRNISISRNFYSTPS